MSVSNASINFQLISKSTRIEFYWTWSLFIFEVWWNRIFVSFHQIWGSFWNSASCLCFLASHEKKHAKHHRIVHTSKNHFRTSFGIHNWAMMCTYIKRIGHNFCVQLTLNGKVETKQNEIRIPNWVSIGHGEKTSSEMKWYCTYVKIKPRTWS